MPPDDYTGNPKSSLLDVDAAVKSNLQMKLEALLMLAVYKLKIVLCGLALKQLFKLMLEVTIWTWLVAWAATFSSCFWDPVITSVIMDEVEKRAAGVSNSGATETCCPNRHATSSNCSLHKI